MTANPHLDRIAAAASADGQVTAQPTIASLQNEIARLREICGRMDEQTPPEWGLSDTQERLVLAMWQAHPGVLTHRRALALVWPAKQKPDGHIISVMIVNIRKKMGRRGIIRALPTRGWFLADEIAAELHEFNAIRR